MAVYVSNDRVAWKICEYIGKRFLRGIYVLDGGEWKVIEAILKWPEWRTGKRGERRRNKMRKVSDSKKFSALST